MGSDCERLLINLPTVSFGSSCDDRVLWSCQLEFGPGHSDLYETGRFRPPVMGRSPVDNGVD
jgi:hypothetical protein